MLKIKDNVDLKELEKYAFEQGCFGFSRIFYFSKYVIAITIDTLDKKIRIQSNYYDANCMYEILNVIYNLIKADLVEKVDD